MLTIKQWRDPESHRQNPPISNHNNIQLRSGRVHVIFIGMNLYSNGTQINKTNIMILHYCDAIMGRVASQITSLTIVYTTVYSDADQSKHQSSASLAFVWGIHRDRWIPRTKGQLRGKCFHLMTSSWFCMEQIWKHVILVIISVAKLTPSLTSLISNRYLNR